MYAVCFSDGEYETFRCLSCDKTFVSKPAIGRHFDRDPSHGEVTITAADIETEEDRSDGEVVSRGVAPRQLLDRLTRDEADFDVETDEMGTNDGGDTDDINGIDGIDGTGDCARSADSTGEDVEPDGERPR